MIRRSKLETCIDILEIIAKGVGKPTRIMYKANLSWNPMQKYLRLLVDEGLIISGKKGERMRYEVTEKGIRTLSYFRRVKETLPLHIRK
jgi:predicted transcriptional regulator